MTPMERYIARLGQSGQISRRESSWELIERGVEVLTLFILCAAGVLSGAVFVLVFWGWL